MNISLWNIHPGWIFHYKICTPGVIFHNYSQRGLTFYYDVFMIWLAPYSKKIKTLHLSVLIPFTIIIFMKGVVVVVNIVSWNIHPWRWFHYEYWNNGGFPVLETSLHFCLKSHFFLASQFLWNGWGWIFHYKILTPGGWHFIVCLKGAGYFIMKCSPTRVAVWL